MDEKTRVFILTLLLLASLGWLSWDKLFSPANHHPPQLCFGSQPDSPLGEFPVSLEPPAKLDGFMKDKIYELRRGFVAKNPELVSRYAPDDEVFGEIQDGKPWWGLEGAYFYGEGIMSTQGLSVESRPIFNPLMLIAAREPYVVNGLMPDGATNYDPAPVALSWNCSASAARVVYDVSRYFFFIKPRTFLENQRELFIVAYNARDMGFNYFYIDPLRSRNILKEVEQQKPVPILQHLHLSTACGFPGDCNGITPLYADTYTMELR